MRNIILAGCCLLFAACGGEREADSGPGDSDLLPATLVRNPRTADRIDSAVVAQMPEMSFLDTIHDFGEVPLGAELDCEFVFVNTGATPLLVSGVNPSCGCTVGSHPTEPVLPGDTSRIAIRFKPTGEGGFEEKSVSINTNTPQGIHKIYIRAQVTGTR